MNAEHYEAKSIDIFDEEQNSRPKIVRYVIVFFIVVLVLLLSFAAWRYAGKSAQRFASARNPHMLTVRFNELADKHKDGLPLMFPCRVHQARRDIPRKRNDGPRSGYFA